MSDFEQPSRWADDLHSPAKLRADLQRARGAQPSPAAVDAMLANIYSAAAQPSTGAAHTAPSAPPPTQATWHLGAKFWLGVTIPVCVIALLLGRASSRRDVAHEQPVSTANAEPVRSTVVANGAPHAPTTATDMPANSQLDCVLSLDDPDAGASIVRAVATPCDEREHQRRVSQLQVRLSSRDFAGVLSMAQSDRARCPRASMAEERERAVIEALVRSDRREDALGRWRAFLRAFPRSLYTRALGVLIER